MIQRKDKKSVIVSLSEGAFHLSELARQTIPVVTFNKNFSQILSGMHKGDGFSAKTLGKSVFHFPNDWSSYGPAGPVNRKTPFE